MKFRFNHDQIIATMLDRTDMGEREFEATHGERYRLMLADYAEDVHMTPEELERRTSSSTLYWHVFAFAFRYSKPADR